MVSALIMTERFAQYTRGETDMTIAIDDISMTEPLDREALTKVSGGIAEISSPSPWYTSLPQLPSFPDRFPFNGSPLPQPTHEIIMTDPENPLLQ
jgi:hypothetical protein